MSSLPLATGIVLARRHQALDLRRERRQQLGELGRLDAVAARHRQDQALHQQVHLHRGVQVRILELGQQALGQQRVLDRLLHVAERVVRAAAVDPEQAAVARALHQRQLALGALQQLQRAGGVARARDAPTPAPSGCASAACPARACRRRGSRRSPPPWRGRRSGGSAPARSRTSRCSARRRRRPACGAARCRSRWPRRCGRSASRSPRDRAARSMVGGCGGARRRRRPPRAGAACAAAGARAARRPGRRRVVGGRVVVRGHRRGGGQLLAIVATRAGVARSGLTAMPRAVSREETTLATPRSAGGRAARLEWSGHEATLDHLPHRALALVKIPARVAPPAACAPFDRAAGHRG